LELLQGNFRDPCVRLVEDAPAELHDVLVADVDAVVVVDASPNSEMVARLKPWAERYYPPTTWKVLARPP
jgi:hypothetical protein